ncbi:phospholipid carrier-dependent glycosyltransferase [Diaminobutyricimonas sp. LJ205]|uniref:dolichyl-phosphate-mannose--protein mannosyltransferase n=1 Tax=Diaminobutyricimonas sp. LJ205 TaxID=2683590 RepID=UPI0012F52127
MGDVSTEVSAAPRGSRLDEWYAGNPAARRVWRWGVPAAVLGVAAATRLWNLGHPDSLVFDETYYVKDAWTLTNLGYESRWPEGADTAFNAGEVNGYTIEPSFVVHPPLGKWIIGAGLALVGADNPVGWRIGTAVCGILLVAVLMLIAWFLFRSTALTAIAGFLLAIDGNAIVMSRVALLDGILALFVLLGFGAILLDRGWTARRLRLWLASRTDASRPTDWGPVLWWRPWLLVAGLTLGFAAAVKWNGLYFLAFFAVYTLVVDALDRRRLGIPFWISGTLLKQAPASFLLTVPVALVAYLITWAGWFATDDGFYRHWVEDGNLAWTGPLAWVPVDWQNFWHYQVSVYNYHVGETRPHSYQANPLTWLLLIRPTSMYYAGTEHGGTTYGSTILDLANPIIWWASVAAALYLVYRLIRFRDWRHGAILMGLLAGYLPWLMYLERTVFQFYTIAFQSFLILALTAVFGLMLGTPADPRWRRDGGIRLIAVILAVATAVSVFFWPIWTALEVPWSFIQLHYWLPNWR